MKGRVDKQICTKDPNGHFMKRKADTHTQKNKREISCYFFILQLLGGLNC